MARKHTLPPEMTIYAVGANRQLFQEWVSKLQKGRRAAALQGSPLALDSSAVMEVDAAGIQLLLSLSRSVAALQRPLRLENPTERLAAACRSLGAGVLLESGAAPGVEA
jgi:anti-anti-sigma regulatory factor